MKAATVKELKEELSGYSQKELVEICLRLSKFKKENKELLTYLLYDSKDEMTFIRNVKEEIDLQFDQVNKKSYYYMKKSIRKILSNTRKYIRYSKEKETEVELLIYFCERLSKFKPSIKRNKVLRNLYLRQLEVISKSISKLHEDLQYDYGNELEKLSSM